MRRRKRARPGRPEGKRTWILVALRAATEPVKEEAMQAIFVECVLGGVQEERVRKMAKQSHRNPLTYEPDFVPRPVPARGNQIPRADWPQQANRRRSLAISILFWTVERKKSRLAVQSGCPEESPVSVVSHWTLIFARVDDQ